MKANLETWRRRRQFTQEGLASAAGVSKATIQRYEREGLRSATVHTLSAVLMALDVDPNQLILELDKEV